MTTAQTVLCERYSAGFLDTHRRDGFVVPHALIAQTPAVTGSGAPDAHCAADPDLGIHDEVLVWDRHVPVRRVEPQLSAHGFTRHEAERDAITRFYSAPAGVPDEIGGLASQLRSISVTAPSTADPATSIFRS